MSLADRLIEDNKKREAIRKRRDLDPDEEDTYMYKPYEQISRGINTEKGAFTSVFSSGLNKEESVFDRQALFRTKDN